VKFCHQALAGSRALRQKRTRQSAQAKRCRKVPVGKCCRKALRHLLIQQQYPLGVTQMLSTKGVAGSIAGSRLRIQVPGNFFYRQIHGRPVPPCFPATWRSWMEALVAFEHQQPGISENCSKDPLGLCAYLLFWVMFCPPN
jgi:hypothetical protein